MARPHCVNAENARQKKSNVSASDFTLAGPVFECDADHSWLSLGLSYFSSVLSDELLDTGVILCDTSYGPMYGINIILCDTPYGINISGLTRPPPPWGSSGAKCRTIIAR